MKRFARLSLLLALIWVSASSSAASAATMAEPHRGDAAVPGSELARELSEITGVAISPLLGVSAVGVWKYSHANTEQERARLPWFARPWFWIPGLLLVMAWFLKDVLGVAAPPLLKKPLDVADALSHKVSGLIATGAFVPLIISVFPSARPEAAVPHASGFLAIVDFSWLGNALLVPFAMLIFFVVFLGSNALNILVLLSPFGPVDAILKAFRGLLLLTVTATAFVNPWLGAAWALVVITVAYFISGWSSRLSWLGLEFIWDFLTLRRKRFIPDKAANRMFLARKINGVPARTYGTLGRDQSGRFVLRYRPWLMLAPRTTTLPPAQYAVARGLFYSQIVRVERDSLVSTMLLPPRYRGHEEELVFIYALAGVRPGGLLAAWRWMQDALGVGMAPAGACS